MKKLFRPLITIFLFSFLFFFISAKELKAIDYPIPPPPSDYFEPYTDTQGNVYTKKFVLHSLFQNRVYAGVCRGDVIVQNGKSFSPSMALYMSFPTGQPDRIVVGNRGISEGPNGNYYSSCYIIGSYSLDLNVWSKHGKPSALTSDYAIGQGIAIYQWDHTGNGISYFCPQSYGKYVMSELPLMYQNPYDYNQKIYMNACTVTTNVTLSAKAYIQYPVGAFDYVTSPPEGPAPNGDFYLVITNTTGKYHIWSNSACYIDLSGENVNRPLVCPSDSVVKVENSGTLSPLSDLSNLFLEPTGGSYCNGIIYSTYKLRDEQGQYVCDIQGSDFTDEYSSAFIPPVSFNPDDHDWGAFNWFKTVVSFFADMINGVAEWFYNLWQGFLNLIIPDMDVVNSKIDEVSLAFYDKIPIDSFNSFVKFVKGALGSNDSATPPDIYMNFGTFGQARILSFEWISPHIVYIRSALIFVIVLTTVVLIPKLIAKIGEI